MAERLTKEDVIYILNAMKNRDYKPRINEHTGTDCNDMNRAALEYAIFAIGKLTEIEAAIKAQSAKEEK